MERRQGAFGQARKNEIALIGGSFSNSLTHMRAAGSALIVGSARYLHRTEEYHRFLLICDSSVAAADGTAARRSGLLRAKSAPPLGAAPEAL